MPSDLPDYTRLVTVNVNIPEVQVGPVNVGKYAASPADLPDGTRTPLITDIKGHVLVIPKPQGGVLEKDSITTTSSYQTVVTRTVTDGKSFQLAKIIVSCDRDVVYKLRWNEVNIGAEVYVAEKIPFTDWFPWNYYPMAGDGSKAFDVQVKYPSGGLAGTCNVEIVGEEV